MANYDATIDNFVYGDDLDVRRSVENLPTGQTVVKAWLTVKEAPDQTDAQATLQKSITDALSIHGQITDVGSTGTAQLLFTLTALETLNMIPGVRYYYDIQVRTSADKIFTPEVGRLKGIAGVTITNV